jgi:hypothetical protein
MLLKDKLVSTFMMDFQSWSERGSSICICTVEHLEHLEIQKKDLDAQTQTLTLHLGAESHVTLVVFPQISLSTLSDQEK